MDSKNIMPIWQPQGYSTHYISQQISERLGLKTSHTGTLDPMAEGVIIVLLGEERFKKYEYAKWIKGYEFEITLGISTDTFDGMGLITHVNLGNTHNIFDNTSVNMAPNNINKTHIKSVLKTFLGNYEQTVPIYSTKKIKGKHLHEYARENLEVDLPIKNGEIFKLDLLEIIEKPLSLVVNENIEKISNVVGDFRQSEITAKWKELLKSPQNNHMQDEEKIMVLRLYVETTKGIYVNFVII